MMLDQARSAWKVAGRGSEAGQGFALERRVPEPMADAAREAFRAPRAEDHLRKAWGAAGVLGKMVVALRDAPSKWELVFGGSPAIGQVEAVRHMADLLWTGQTDRHGSDDPQTSIPVTQEQAEAAVHLAVLLVQLFATGAVRRKP